ncbi:MAG: hypothetical protein ACYTGW_15690 [Planctomycetota bacterium]|jgi:hypothetical protein
MQALRTLRDRTAAALFLLAPLAICSALPGQLQKQGPSPKKAIRSLVKQLSDNEAWWDARSALLRRATTHQQPVLRAVSAVARSGKGLVQKRARLVLDTLIQQHVRAQKQRERLQQLEAVKDAFAELRGAAGKTAVQAMHKALKDLEKCLATEKPLNMAPLAVPMQPNMPHQPNMPAGTDDLSTKYRKIKVGDKTVLVPKDQLGDDDNYEAEFKDGALHIRRLPKKKGKKKQKESSDKEKDKETEEDKDKDKDGKGKKRQ